MRDYNETTFDDLPPQLLETISEAITITGSQPTNACVKLTGRSC